VETASRKARIPAVYATVLIVLGTVLVIAGLLTPRTTGTPVPYAPGEEAPSAQADAKSAHGYTSDIVTVYEGAVAGIDFDVHGDGPGATKGPSYHVSLASGAPALYALQDIDDSEPPVLAVGEVVRVWTVIDQDASGVQQRFVVRMDAHGARWVSGTNRYRMPTKAEGGSPPAVAALALGGAPAGAVVVLCGVALLYRRTVFGKPLRTVDHVAVWGSLLAIPAAAGWFELVHANPQDVSVATGLVPLVLLLPAVGFVAGVWAAFTRKSGNPAWPSVIGILPGAVLLIGTVLGTAILFVGGCRVVYC